MTLYCQLQLFDYYANERKPGTDLSAANPCIWFLFQQQGAHLQGA